MHSLAMMVDDNRRNLPMTVLYRSGGNWSAVDRARLVCGLVTEVQSHPTHPEYLVLHGHHTEQQVSNALGGDLAFSLTPVTGLDNLQLPFTPQFA
jgi:hypothetical protein